MSSLSYKIPLGSGIVAPIPLAWSSASPSRRRHFAVSATSELFSCEKRRWASIEGHISSVRFCCRALVHRHHHTYVSFLIFFFHRQERRRAPPHYHLTHDFLSTVLYPHCPAHDHHHVLLDPISGRLGGEWHGKWISKDMIMTYISARNIRFYVVPFQMNRPMMTRRTSFH